MSPAKGFGTEQEALDAVSVMLGAGRRCQQGLWSQKVLSGLGAGGGLLPGLMWEPRVPSAVRAMRIPRLVREGAVPLVLQV